MFQLYFKRLLAVTTIIAALAIGTADGFAAEQTPKSAISSNEVKKVLNERLAILIEIQKLTQQAYLSSEMGFQDVLAAEKGVLSAKLELADTPAERIAILEEMLENAQRLEKTAEKMTQANEVPITDHLQAKAYRMRVQADLLQACATKQN